MDWLISLAGFVVGLLVGITGVGGGALMTPLLILGFNIPPVVAVGTDLFFAAITKSVGGLTHAIQKSVDWNLVLLLSAGSIPSAVVCLFFISELQQQINIDGFIRITVAIALFITTIFMLCRNYITTLIVENCPNFLKKFKKPMTIIAGCTIGFLVTVSSIGAGAIGIVVISILYPRMNSVKIVGSDIVHAVPLTTIAGFGHFFLGSVDTTLLALLLIGSLPGIYIGSRLSQYLPDQMLRYILAAVLFIIGIKLIS